MGVICPKVFCSAFLAGSYIAADALAMDYQQACATAGWSPFSEHDTYSMAPAAIPFEDPIPHGPGARMQLFAEDGAAQLIKLPRNIPTEIAAAKGGGSRSWEEVPLTLNSRGFVKNEREQYGAYDSVRELINNQYDAGATEVHIEVTKKMIRITGNGHPIDDPHVLTEVFTDVKRSHKTVVDVSGRERKVIGEKGRGRFAFVRDADRLTIASRFGEFQLRVTGEEEIEARMRPCGKRSRLARMDGTVSTMRRRYGKFDIKGIGEFIRNNYRYFKGSNFKIVLNGEAVPMKEFVPHTRAWLGILRGFRFKKMLEDEFGFKRIFDNCEILARSSDSVFPILIYDEGIAKFLQAQDHGLYSVDIEFSPREGEYDSRQPNTFLLSQLNPVKSNRGLSYDFDVIATVNTDLPLDPSRKGFASHTFTNNSIDGEWIESALSIAVRRALALYFEKSYKEHGWHRYHEYRTPQVLNFEYDKIAIPDLEVEVRVHESHSTETKIMTFAELAKASEEKPVIVYTDRDRHMDMVDKLIQRGHIGLKMKVRATSKDVVTHNGIKRVVSGTSDFVALSLEHGFDITDVGSRDRHEELVLYHARQVAKFADVDDVIIDIATMTDDSVDAIFKRPNLIILNRASGAVASHIQDAKEYLFGDPESSWMMITGLAPLVIAELAHYKIAKEQPLAKLEHEQTAVYEKRLYETFLEILSSEFRKDAD